MRGVNLVVAKREIRKVVLSVTAGECSSVERSVHVGDGDLGACDRCALLIRYRAADGSRRDLPSRAESAAQHQRKNCKRRKNRAQFAKFIIQIQTINLHSFTPRGDIRAKKKETTKSAQQRISSDCFGFVLFHPNAFSRRPQPLKHYGT